MKKNGFEDKRLLEAVDHIDKKYISEALGYYDNIEKSVPKRRVGYILSLAACLALLVAAVPLITYLIPRIGTAVGIGTSDGPAGAVGSSDVLSESEIYTDNPISESPIPETDPFTEDWGEITYSSRDEDMSDRDLIERVGTVPKEFYEIINNKLFVNSYATGDRVYVRSDVDGEPDLTVYDKYGQLIAEIDLEGGVDSYRIYELSDGNYLKIRAYDSYYTIKDGVDTKHVIKASVEKFTKDGVSLFETEFDILSDLYFVGEVDGGYIISGGLQNWAHIKEQNYYLYKLDHSGNIVKQIEFKEADGYSIRKIEYIEEEIVLYNYNKKSKNYYKIYLNDSLSTKKTVASDAPVSKTIYSSGFRNYYAYWNAQDFFSGLYEEEGQIKSVIYYEDFILFISEHDTKCFQYYTPHWDGSNIASYTETVYAAYTYDAELIWRTAVDSTDYEYLASLKNEYDEFFNKYNQEQSETE